MTLLITMTNVCFARGKVIGKVMVYRYPMDRDIHAYLIVEIVSIFQRMYGHRQD